MVDGRKIEGSKFNEFYDGLVSERFVDDEQAADFLYDTTPLDDKYRQLKSRFSKRLLNTLFFLDSNDPSAQRPSVQWSSAERSRWWGFRPRFFLLEWSRRPP